MHFLLSHVYTYNSLFFTLTHLLIKGHMGWHKLHRGWLGGVAIGEGGTGVGQLIQLCLRQLGRVKGERFKLCAHMHMYMHVHAKKIGVTMERKELYGV